jgi:glycine betaine/proline transport system permease protein
MIAKIPLGAWIQESVQYLTTRFDSHLRLFSEGLSTGIGSLIQKLIEYSPWWIIGVLVVLTLGLSRNWKNALWMLVGLSLIVNLGYWQETLETVALVGISTLISVGVGIPIGILCAHQRWLYRGVHPVLDLMQTIPTFVYLIPTLMLFGLGLAPGVISTVVFAMPAPIRMTYLGITSVPLCMSEVGDAFGATTFQKLFTIEIPHALPMIRSGISQCVMLSLSMVVIAALVGADGLGKPVVQALNTVNIAKGFEAGMVIVILAILLDRMLSMKQKKNPVAVNG